MVESTHTTKTLINIGKQITTLMNNAIRKSFPMPDFNSSVQWNATGTSDLCSPSAMKIYNMNNKKADFIYKSSKEVAEEIIKNFEKHEMIGELIVTQQQTGPTKPEKENPNGKANKISCIQCQNK